MSFKTPQDIWPFSKAVGGCDPQPAQNDLAVARIAEFEPLDDQFRKDVKRTVPDAFRPFLFGDREPATPFATYAILDGAGIVNLPQMLEASGLAHRCLFIKDAFETLGDVAPWIVRLEDGHDLTRSLFTKGTAPWHLWDTAPGFYIRSRATLDELWAHFRKFTRVKDAAGKWYYFRFWEGTTLFSVARSAPAGDVSRLIAPGMTVFARKQVDGKAQMFAGRLLTAATEVVSV